MYFPKLNKTVYIDLYVHSFSKASHIFPGAPWHSKCCKTSLGLIDHFESHHLVNKSANKNSAQYNIILFLYYTAGTEVGYKSEVEPAKKTSHDLP